MDESELIDDHPTKRELKRIKIKEHNEDYEESKKPKQVKVSGTEKRAALLLMAIAGTFAVNDKALDKYLDVPNRKVMKITQSP